MHAGDSNIVVHVATIGMHACKKLNALTIIHDTSTVTAPTTALWNLILFILPHIIFKVYLCWQYSYTFTCLVLFSVSFILV